MPCSFACVISQAGPVELLIEAVLQSRNPCETIESRSNLYRPALRQLSKIPRGSRDFRGRSTSNTERNETKGD